MLQYTDTEVVFKEVPDEITLAINISGCPIHCPGCHSKELWENIGEELNIDSLSALINKNRGISCVSFMGGDNNPEEINLLSGYIKSKYPQIKVAWYSGRSGLSDKIDLNNLDYVKLGPYIEKLGGLDNPITNQTFYMVGEENKLIDITEKFQK